jgi:hypothetical protein
MGIIFRDGYPDVHIPGGPRISIEGDGIAADY